MSGRIVITSDASGADGLNAAGPIQDKLALRARMSGTSGRAELWIGAKNIGGGECEGNMEIR